MNKLTCPHCHAKIKPKRNINQQYCNNKVCQNVRKNKWRTQKLKNDPDYRANRNAASKKWRNQNSGYWSRYRNNHSDYVQRNRIRQKARNLKRSCKSDASVIAKSDALTKKPIIKTGTYRLIPCDAMIANSDALLVNIAVISNNCDGLSAQTM